MTENTTNTGKIALQSGIICILSCVEQLQSSEVWFHQGFWFNFEFYRPSIMCSASWNFILASPPPESEYLQTSNWKDLARQYTTVESSQQNTALLCKLLDKTSWGFWGVFLQNCRHVNRTANILKSYHNKGAPVSTLKKVMCQQTFCLKWKWTWKDFKIC